MNTPQIGAWMRDKKTGEAVKVLSVGAMIKYGNDDIQDGSVRNDRLTEHFDIMDDPTERDDIEFLLLAKIEAGEADTGLYKLDVSYVVADRVMSGGKDVVTFQWFDHMMNFQDVLND